MATQRVVVNGLNGGRIAMTASQIREALVYNKPIGGQIAGRNGEVVAVVERSADTNFYHLTPEAREKLWEAGMLPWRD